MNHYSKVITLLKPVVLAAISTVLAASCAPLEKAAPPVSELTLPKKANRKKLEEGRQLYATACIHCHGPARVDRHGSDENWTQNILPKMCPKAKLSAAETEALQEYVLAARQSLAKPASG